MKPNKDIFEQLAVDIKYGMIAKRMSNSELCRKLGMARSTFYRHMEHPETFTLKHLAIMATVFGWERGKYL